MLMYGRHQHNIVNTLQLKVNKLKKKQLKKPHWALRHPSPRGSKNMWHTPCHGDAHGPMADGQQGCITAQSDLYCDGGGRRGRLSPNPGMGGCWGRWAKKKRSIRTSGRLDKGTFLWQRLCPPKWGLMLGHRDLASPCLWLSFVDSTVLFQNFLWVSLKWDLPAVSRQKKWNPLS